MFPALHIMKANLTSPLRTQCPTAVVKFVAISIVSVR
jgi:hypothetical protein